MSSILSDKKNIIMNFIQEYIDRGRKINFNRITHFIRDKCSKNAININNQGIILILKSLLQHRYRHTQPAPA